MKKETKLNKKKKIKKADLWMRSVYLASPYTHKNLKIQTKRFLLVTRIASELCEEYGYAFDLPITTSHLLAAVNLNLSTGFDTWEDIDFYKVAQNDEFWIVTMEGWKTSIGVQKELKYAKELRKPIYFINPISLSKKKYNYSRRLEKETSI